MNSSRIWIYRALTLVGAGLMLVSWFLPWWSANIYELSENAVVIRPWGLEHQLGAMADTIAGAEMPSWFAPFMWAFLGIGMLSLLLSLIAREKVFQFIKIKLSLPQLLVGGVGVAYMVSLAVAAIYGSMRAGDFYDVNFLGYSYVTMGDHHASGVQADLLLGYWLGWVVGLGLGVLGLLRYKIIGESKPVEQRGEVKPLSPQGKVKPVHS